MKAVSPSSTSTPTPPHSPDATLRPIARRRWLGWGLAGMATLASSSLAARNANAESPASPANQDPLWSLSLPDPHGSQLIMADYLGQALVINFWATWCAPCVEELPLLNAFHAKDNGWSTIGIAVDTPANVQRFIQRFELAFPIGIAGAAGLRLSRELGNTSGLPYTLVVDKQGMIRDRKIGQITAVDLANWALLA